MHGDGFEYRFEIDPFAREMLLKGLGEVRAAPNAAQAAEMALVRLAFAVMMEADADVLLIDEVLAVGDAAFQQKCADAFREMKAAGKTVILVTHDLGMAAEFCSRIAVMYAGRIVEQGTVDQVVENPQHPYTQGLLDCRPRISMRQLRLQPIPGNVPDLAALPAGCAFAPRCSFRQEVCEGGPVPLVAIEQDHTSRCLLHNQFQRNPEWDWHDTLGVET